VIEQTDFSNSSIDADGFRANVGIVLANNVGQLFLAKRIGMDAWQFPQGGIRPKERVEEAMYRELHEEIGLLPEHVEIMGCTRDWLKYELPERFVRKYSKPLCRGQKQKWYLLKFLGNETAFRLDLSATPEFDHWRWVDFWEPVNEVIEFKRDVYREALAELEQLLILSGLRRQLVPPQTGNTRN
jgi:putative (di)nucleoside polyphosphate hydrolase